MLTIIGTGEYFSDGNEFDYIIKVGGVDGLGIAGQVNSNYTGSCGSKNRYTKKYYTYNYNPVVTLNSNIKIKNFNNCSNGKVRGSKECPFELVES